MQSSSSKTAKNREGSFGILVSGGPAPGINSVIASSTIEAINRGYKVYGFQDGFKGACSTEANQTVELQISDVSAIAHTGGSILGTSRFNPFHNAAHKNTFLNNLKQHNIDKLIVIGGEGTAYLSTRIIAEAPQIQLVHVPKTIDNDLILPHNHPSFGFETARYAGACILKTLAVDAKTTKSFFLVTSMGRRAGFLALGLGLASGSMLTLIREEFPDNKTTPQAIAEIMVRSIKKRFDMQRAFGVIVVAEGVIECIDPESSPEIAACPRDEMGRLRLSQIELDDILMPSIKKELGQAGIDIKLNCKNIGYELRCHEPISYDVEYTKFLGFGAVELLLQGAGGVIVTRDFDKLSYRPLSSMMSPSGEILSRCVDLKSDLYRIARSYMIR